MSGEENKIGGATVDSGSDEARTQARSHEWETIVAVACQFIGPCTDSPAGQILITATMPPPARHHSVMWGLGRVLPDGQGFLTSTGRFVGRKEAADIAMAAGQIEADKLVSAPNLYSEDLW